MIHPGRTKDRFLEGHCRRFVLGGALYQLEAWSLCHDECI